MNQQKKLAQSKAWSLAAIDNVEIFIRMFRKEKREDAVQKKKKSWSCNEFKSNHCLLGHKTECSFTVEEKGEDAEAEEQEDIGTYK